MPAFVFNSLKFQPKFLILARFGFVRAKVPNKVIIHSSVKMMGVVVAACGACSSRAKMCEMDHSHVRKNDWSQFSKSEDTNQVWDSGENARKLPVSGAGLFAPILTITLRLCKRHLCTAEPQTTHARRQNRVFRLNTRLAASVDGCALNCYFSNIQRVCRSQTCFYSFDRLLIFLERCVVT